MPDLEQTAGEEAEPQEGQLDISPEAKSSWDRRLEKRGLSSGTEKEEAGGDAQQPAATPPARPQRATAPAPDTRALPPARGHRERLAARQSQAALNQRLDKLEETLRSLLPKDPEINPDEDPTAYTSDLIKKAALEALGGPEVVEYLREQRQQWMDHQEYQKAVREESAFYRAWGDEMTTWEEEYRAKFPDQAAGYEERLQAFMNVSMQQFMELGDSQQVAHRKAVRGLIALTDQALQAEIHPVAYVDRLFRRSGFVPKSGNGNGHEDPRKAQAAGNREIAERRKAGAAASTLSTTKAPPAPSTAGKIAAAVEDAPAGKGRAGAIARAARAAGGNAKANLRELRGR